MFWVRTVLGMFCFTIAFLRFKFYYSNEGGKQVTLSTKVVSLQSSLFKLISTDKFEFWSGCGLLR